MIIIIYDSLIKYIKFINNRFKYNLCQFFQIRFVEDEKKHNQVNLPITRAEILAEKERLYQINHRLPKKVVEAKWRKQNKMVRQLKRAKQKSEQAYNEEGVSESVKMRNIQRIYKKEMQQKKKGKAVIVGRKFKAGSSGGNSKSTKLVDKRLRKDERAQKHALIKKNGIRKSKRMQRKRKQRK